MSYIDLTDEFNYKDLIFWQNMDALAENDKFIRESYSNYRRPNLIYISDTQVDVENNVSTLNETKIVFPGNEVRTVLEDTSLTNKFRRFDITQAAEFISGTENSGLHSSLSEASNTWYCIYAVKSQLNENNFVLVGDTLNPSVSNWATLNSRYGVNGWLYLGAIRNGDGDAAPSNIIEFKQSAERTFFNNNYGGAGVESPGIKFLNAAATGTQTWTYATGSSGLVVPDNFGFIEWWVLLTGTSSEDLAIQNDAGTVNYSRLRIRANQNVRQMLMPADEGIKIISGSGTTPKASLWGWHDNALGLGFNPQF